MEPAQDEQEVEGDQSDPAAAARREAASYRRRLRDVEAERDTLTTTLDNYRRREVEQLAEVGTDFGTYRMQTGADLWLAGIELPSLLGEDGTVDPKKVKATVAEVLKARPHWGREPFDAGQGFRGSTAPSQASFADVLRKSVTG